jgi:hypothetical protein
MVARNPGARPVSECSRLQFKVNVCRGMQCSDACPGQTTNRVRMGLGLTDLHWGGGVVQAGSAATRRLPPRGISAADSEVTQHPPPRPPRRLQQLRCISDARCKASLSAAAVARRAAGAGLLVGQRGGGVGGIWSVGEGRGIRSNRLHPAAAASDNASRPPSPPVRCSALRYLHRGGGGFLLRGRRAECRRRAASPPPQRRDERASPLPCEFSAHLPCCWVFMCIIYECA